MKKRGFMVLVAAAIVPVCLMFLTSCAKEAFKETPGAPSFEEEQAALPEEQLAPGEEAMAGAVQEEGKMEWKPEEPTEAEKLAALREQALREQEEMERRERERLEKELREQQEEAMRQREQMAREMQRDETEVARLEAEKRLVQLREEFESEPIYFAFDSAVLTDSAKDILRKKAAFMIENRNVGVMIEGHCDERGSVEYNLALGQRRAESTQRYLVLLGVELSRTRTISYGNERPVDPRHDETAWAKNRRCEFVLEPR